MKRSPIILLLALLQSACSHHDIAPNPAGMLLSFADISAEITVTHETLDAVTPEAVAAESQPLAFSSGE